MPMKPKKPCRHPGCPKLTDGLYCEEQQARLQQAVAEGKGEVLKSTSFVRAVYEGRQGSDRNRCRSCETTPW